MSTSNWIVVVVTLAALLIGSNLWRLDPEVVIEPCAAEGVVSNSSTTERRAIIEALHSQNVEYEKLLGIVLQVSKPLERAQILGVFQAELAIKPIIQGDFVLFGRLALQFDENERLMDLYMAIEGTTTPARVVIESSTDG